MQQPDVEKLIGELELGVDRLRSLYEQYFMGIEKIEPAVPRKDVDRRIHVLRKEQIRNTALRFRFQMIIQRYNTYQTHWQRICREIENGTYKRHVMRANRRFETDRRSTAPPARRSSIPPRPDAAAAAAGIPSPLPPPAPTGFPQPGAAVAIDLAAELADLESEFGPVISGPIHPLPSPVRAQPQPAGTVAKPVPPPAPQRQQQLSPGAPPAAVPKQPPPPLPAPGTLVRPGVPLATPTAARPPLPPPNASRAPAVPFPQPAPRAPAPAPGPAPATGALAGPRAPAPARPAAALAKGAVQPAKPIAATADLPEHRVRAIYEQYVDAKRRQKESTAAITYEAIAKTLRDSSAKLREKHGKSIDFEVAIRDGKAILKPVIK